MICLACDADSANTLPQCSKCGAPFSRQPPFLHPNHVSQLVGAIQAFSEGNLDREGLFRRLDAFVRIYTTVDQDWDFSQALLPRLNDLLADAGSQRDYLNQAVELLDESMEVLGEAVGGLELLRDGSGPATEADRRLLEASGENLVHFFRAACTGAATIMNIIEASNTSSDRLGSMIDIEVS